MPRKPQPWFRFYVEAMSDRKLRRLPPEYRWLYVACLAAARTSPIPGWLLVHDGDDGGEMDEQDMADWAGMRLSIVTAGMAALERLRLVGRDGETRAWYIPNWSARQFESDDVTVRTRKHRSKERSNVVLGNAPEQSRAEQTPLNVPVDETPWTMPRITKDVCDEGLAVIHELKAKS